MVEMKKTWSVPLPKGWYYSGAEDFVIQNGAQFDVDYEILNKYPMGEEKQCYKNAFELTLFQDDLIYVEGFACTVIPTMHAWVVDKNGNVYDPTWRLNTREKKYYPIGYYGVMFSLRQCWKVMEKSGQYGMLDAWKADWPLFRQQFIKEVTL
jgi:hypothetical protein